jgi:glycogen operon protein
VLWTEWNGKYRDCVRRFWRGDNSVVPEMATRLSGSSDLYEASGRRPYASINFVTCHDGFTLQDLVSYNDKHNEANGEGNRDGANDNHSWNCGAEGRTDDAAIRELRQRQRRNFIVTLMISHGVPMLLSGDEIGHTQNGNNNGYCQDNEITWLSWNLDEAQKSFLDFVSRVIRLRHEQPVLRRRRFLHGQPVRGVQWLSPDGQEMTQEDWNTAYVRCLGMLLSGENIGEVDERGVPVIGDTLLVLLNAAAEPIPFTLPVRPEDHWEPVLDTAKPVSDSAKFAGGHVYELQGRAVAIFRLPPLAVPDALATAASSHDIASAPRPGQQADDGDNSSSMNDRVDQ